LSARAGAAATRMRRRRKAGRNIQRFLKGGPRTASPNCGGIAIAARSGDEKSLIARKQRQPE
jgi:hypothetical protein